MKKPLGANRQTISSLILSMALSMGLGCHADPAVDPAPAKPAETAARAGVLEKAETLEPVPGFVLHHNMDKDGKVQPGPMKESAEWRVADFYHKGIVRVDKDVLYLEKGNDMTGVTWRGPLPRMNYEITLEAMRVDGEDFFCGLTFPVNAESCSLILGGWGGSVVGLSSIDYEDAANNQTTRSVKFESNRWYRVRVRVYGEKIEAWLDGDKIVDIVTTGHKIGIRWEMEACVPLGIATWRTTGAIRAIKLEGLTEQPFDYQVKK